MSFADLRDLGHRFADCVERLAYVIAAASAVQHWTDGTTDNPTRPKTHDEWAAEVVERAAALRRAVRS